MEQDGANKKAIFHDLFGPGSNIGRRIVRDYEEITIIVAAIRMLGLKVVLTSGTYDMTHIGHLRYLENARGHGDLLIVGVDSDEKVRGKKGPNRPIVHQDERMEILCHSRHADVVFLKEPEQERWKLIKTVKPDVLIATQGTYTPEQVEELEKNYCGEVIVLEPQATTSTTAKIRKILVGPIEEVKQKVQEVMTFLNSISGDGGGKIE
ncbi:MAG: adenylyltransferase/cytidyltransferase family protein [Patescibacteria group bacterium]